MTQSTNPSSPSTPEIVKQLRAMIADLTSRAIADDLDEIFVAQIRERIRIIQLAADRLEALERREEEKRTWQPMRTAPKDGTQILIYAPKRYQGKGGISWACFVNGEWLDSRAMRLAEGDISHWMPMPEPPRASSEENKEGPNG